MSQFWKTIDQKYYAESIDDLPDLDLWRKGNVSESLKEIENDQKKNTKEILITKELASLVGSTFYSKAFDIDGNPHKSEINFKNFMVSVSLTLSSYGFLMKMLNEGILPCEKCLENLNDLMDKNYHEILNQLDEKETECINEESGSVDSQVPFSFCRICLEKTYFKIKSVKLPEMKLINQQKIKKLVEIAEERKRQTKTKMTNIEVFNQIESQKVYLVKSLLTLEKKILSDTIFKVHYAKKNKCIEVLLANKNFKFSIRMTDLLELDKLRENSLFKIAKSSFKCYRSYFSYNVY